MQTHRPTSRIDELSASPRVFDNPILDKLSRVHWTFPLVYLPIAAWLVWQTPGHRSTAAIVACIIAGYAIWTFMEYLFHRWIFHWEMPGKFGERLHFLLHGIHHVHPNDPLRLVMPPLMSVPMMLFAWPVATLLFRFRTALSRTCRFHHWLRPSTTKSIFTFITGHHARRSRRHFADCICCITFAIPSGDMASVPHGGTMCLAPPTQGPTSRAARRSNCGDDGRACAHASSHSRFCRLRGIDCRDKV